MFVKICANTNLEDALLATELGADAVGFVFAESRRRVTAEQVATITPHLPESVQKVGVFTLTDAHEILRAAKVAGLTTIQLHSEFNQTLLEQIHAAGLKIFQVIDIPENAPLTEIEIILRTTLSHPLVEAALLDASHGGASGGTGMPFDWNTTAALVRRVAEETSGKVLVAGGLRAANVGEAVNAFQPWGVDVASGVEATFGKKDAEKLRDFITAARAHGTTE